MKPSKTKALVAAPESCVLRQCVATLRSGLDITSGRRASTRPLSRNSMRDDTLLGAHSPCVDRQASSVGGGHEIEGAGSRGDSSDPDKPNSNFEDALTRLVPRLRRFVRRFNGSRQDAEDVVQTACERALLKHGQFQPGTRFDSWMFRIVQTICIDEMRSIKRAPSTADSDEIARLPIYDRTLERIDASLNLEVIRMAISDLPREQRIVLALIVTEEMSYQDVADYLKIPVGTVMSRLSRARCKLRAALPSEA